MTLDPSAGQPFVQITLNQLYSEVTGMRGDLRDLAGTMRSAVGQISDHETRIRELERLTAPLATVAESERERDAERDRRLSAVERRVYTIVGTLGALEIGATAAITLLTKH